MVGETKRSTRNKSSAYATPDRVDIKVVEANDHHPSSVQATTTEHCPHEPPLNTVTPLDATTPSSATSRHVRFGADEEAEDAGESKRGLVSRRGGRLGSPAGNSTTAARDGVLEFKTYRSPQRAGSKRGDKGENDTIPSLCSANSGTLTEMSGKAELAPSSPTDQGVVGQDEEEKTADDVMTEANGKTDEDRPLSISFDASVVTSPLGASPDVVEPYPSSTGAVTRSKTTSETTPTKTPPSSDKDGAACAGKTRNVTFSPPTPQTEVIRVMDIQKKTPMRSPLPGQFQSLPSLQEAKLSSPSGIFLDPPAATPSTTGVAPVPSLDTMETSKAPEPSKAHVGDKKIAAMTETQDAQMARDQERERAVATPTDFALDFGKNLRQTGSFDASNVLAWLQSPTANGLFSPGGLGSALNTPRGVTAPRTPRTPTMSTSFFFSDVASLPRNTEFSPKAEGEGAKRGGVNGPQGVYSSIICISPLSSKRIRGAAQPETPINYNDVFASPRVPTDARPNSLPFLGDTPTKRARKDSNLDADMAERDLSEDEDISVLLQLASHNTPGGVREGGPHVFRSPRGRPTAAGYPPRPGAYGANGAGSNLQGLQLPVIGGRDGDSNSKLARKSMEQQGGTSEDFRPPQLSIRSSSSGGSKEIFLPGGERAVPNASGKDGKETSDSKPPASKNKTTASSAKTKKGAAKKSMSTGYQRPPPYALPGVDSMGGYYSMPGSIPGMPPGGSVRVVVGGPPPMPGGRPKGPSGSPPRHSGSPVRQLPYSNFPPGQGDGGYRHQMPYPHHGHGVYPQHPPPHMSGMGVPPYPGHYPPPHHHPGHLSLYTASQLSQATSDAGKKGKGLKPSKAPTKRPPMAPPTKSPAKKRKSPTKTGKKKRMSPPASTDPVERQKTAAAIAAVNAASGGKHEKEASLAAAILRGVTMRPSGKWQAQLYYAGKSRYIGVFDSREKAALAYEIAREKLKSEKAATDSSAQSLKATEAAVNAARQAAFEGVNEEGPRHK